MSETKSAPFAFTKDGVFYFSRRVPKDLAHHYTSRRIAFSLRTRSATVAASRALRAAQRLDEHWYHLRIANTDLPGKHLLRLGGNVPHGPAGNAAIEDEAVTLSEAVAIYLRLKGKGRPVTFHRGAERSCGYVIDVCGNKPITGYTKADATRFRDSLVGRGLAGSSITRVFGTVRSIINFAANECGLTLTNPFVGVYYDRRAGVADRKPIPMEDIRSIQRLCRAEDDELRWLVALVSDTGLRLAEAAGLLREDLRIDGEDVPHVFVRQHSWRRLKTAGSERSVPLVGSSLWAATRLLSAAQGSQFAFPRYNRTATTNANSASAALNKWMKPHVPDGCTLHGFRHSMRDRLRAVECPSDIVDQIGGWQTEGVGHGYGSGYPLDVLAKWMRAIE